MKLNDQRKSQSIGNVDRCQTGQIRISRPGDLRLPSTYLRITGDQRNECQKIFDVRNIYEISYV